MASAKAKKNRRGAGVLLPIASLPSEYGIGTLGKAAYEWIDFLAAAGQRYWQVLPMGPTGYGDSPYQSFSTFAGNPYFIDLEAYLTKEELAAYDFGEDPMDIDYAKIYGARFLALRVIFEKADLKDPDYIRFKETETWLKDYALYMAIKNSLQGISWQQWPEALKKREEKALAEAEKTHSEEMEFYCYQQYLFSCQWKALKQYAHEKGVEIIGDIPIYVAPDSADSWSRPELFELDEDLVPIRVAGCPPDAFSATGQLWGNPLYRWEAHKEEGYQWWISRIRKSLEFYDVVRIDHFRGFAGYYAIPYGDKTAENGTWEQGPGYDLFEAVRKELGKVRLIAEDLGLLTPDVFRLLKKCGYPGMKVLQFAFDSGSDNPYLPHMYEKNTVIYTGTHDNDTMLGYRSQISRKTLRYANQYSRIRRKDGWCQGMIELALSSVSDTAIIPIQDYLELGSEGRINTPSTLGTNWRWRLKPGQIPEGLAEQILEVTKRYGRA